MRAQRMAAAAAMAALALAACGSGGKNVLTGSAGTAAKTAATAAASSAATNSSTTTASGASTTVPKFSRSGSGDLCSYAKQVSASDLGRELAGSSNLKDTFTKLDEVYKQVQDKAPSEIKADVNTVIAGVKKIEALYAKYDWDAAKFAAGAAQDPAQFTDMEKTLSDPQFTAAAERVGAYFSKVCGIDTGESTTTG